ncbi:hypothetical protein FJ930_29660 [Mesorhizobium sp. B2-4-15]|uniref:hypothetical protein n=1 Tax=Mesorhizobium sp. B2-4-15 TaxID=2589934 RepID=UPI0011548249|nr:hypothetical protein [Mesorhizobium sp. B2-4-15]TPK58608.1 hypothetical protein FJ930_29660 [Mesorhizobium sp. B2-4-15]
MAKWLDIKADRHAAEAVADFLAATKTVEGTDGWSCDAHTEECRLKYLLAIDGIPVSASVDIMSFPMSGNNGFTITLNVPPCIARLDFDPREKFHDNPVGDFSEFESRIYGPHCHAWPDNACLCDSNALPKELSYARPLDPAIMSYQSALFWFCQSVNIVFHNGVFIERPSRGRLL